MQTMNDAHAGPWARYTGEHGRWLIAYSYWSCSESSVDRSNMDELKQRLSECGPDAYAIEDSTVQVSGHISRLIVNPGNARAVSIAEQAAEELDGYPVLNEDLWCEYETEDAEQVWRDCYSPSDRLNELRGTLDHYSPSNHYGYGYGSRFRALRAAVNGDWFAASACFGLSAGDYAY